DDHAVGRASRSASEQRAWEYPGDGAFVAGQPAVVPGQTVVEIVDPDRGTAKDPSFVAAACGAPGVAQQQHGLSGGDPRSAEAGPMDGRSGPQPVDPLQS